jgi:hypothetical protein
VLKQLKMKINVEEGGGEEEDEEGEEKVCRIKRGRRRFVVASSYNVTQSGNVGLRIAWRGTVVPFRKVHITNVEAGIMAQ